jgi:hypothetical protein
MLADGPPTSVMEPFHFGWRVKVVASSRMDRAERERIERP